MNLLRYNGPKAEHLFSLMIDVPKFNQSGCHSDDFFPEELCGCWKSHLEKVKQCNDSAIGVENHEVLPIKAAYTPEGIYYTCDLLPTRIKVLKVNDTFPLPDSIEYEIVKQVEITFDDGKVWNDCRDKYFKTTTNPKREIVRLKLRSLPEKGRVHHNP